MEIINKLNRTPREILYEILGRLSGLDVSPSSANYQSAGAISVELRNIALTILWTLDQTFIKTATGEYLDYLAEQFKFERTPARTAIVKAEIVGADVPEGNRFASVGLADSIIYKVINPSNLGIETEPNIYYLEAEKLNEQANYYTGGLLVIDFLPNITKAEIKEIITPQRAIESDEDFRRRVQENLIAEATDGNVAQYKKWLSEMEGVGKYKVTPIWDGANTVKCTILNDLNQTANPQLIKEVQDVLDPNSEGLGQGLAPIGAIVTVDTATTKTINIDVEVVYKSGKSTNNLQKILSEFFSEIAFDRSVVSYLQVAGAISNDPNIDYITSLKLNSGTQDIPLQANEVPTLGDLNVN